MSAGSSAEIALVDFGMGNLRSVTRAFERAGAKPQVTADPDVVRRADRVVVPGVGALADSMKTLSERGLDEAICERIRIGKPYLGICLGLHILFKDGEEGAAEGLGIVPASVKRFDAKPGLRVPHMGWNQVAPVKNHPVIDSDYYYFVHAYRPTDVPDQYVLAQTEHGEVFPSVLGQDHWLAVQFHPEKSQAAGLKLLERFCSWSP